ALVFGLGMSNNGTGLALAAAALAARPRVLLPVILYNLVQHVVAGAVRATMPAAPGGQAAAEGQGMGIRVLVIEDEEQIADFVTRGLREEGFAVERAGDGDSAWHALQAGPWDVVLLDWWLPGPDGLTLLRRLRQRDRATPVLFLTARDAVSDRVRGLDAGA